MSFIEWTAMSIAAVQQRLLDLAREQALAADLFQRPVLDLVARHLDHHDLERRFGQVKRRHQAAPHLMRLPQRKGRSTGSDLQGLGGAGQRMCHVPRLTDVNRS